MGLRSPAGSETTDNDDRFARQFHAGASAVQDLQTAHSPTPPPKPGKEEKYNTAEDEDPTGL